MTLEDIARKLDLSDIRYSDDGKTIRRQLIPYFKKLYPDADIQLPSDYIDSGMPPMTPEDFARDEANKLKFKKRFKAAGGSYSYPSSYSYEFELGRWHDQKRDGVDEGTCYTESTTAYAEWWLWMKTGKKYDISDNEIRDIGSDSYEPILSYSARQNRSSFYGGWPQKSMPCIYSFNEKLQYHYWTNKQQSASCAKFKELVDSDMGGFSMRTPATNNEEDMKEHLFRYGPSVLTFDGHATLFCAYDSSNIYWRDSYYKSYNWDTLQSMSWSAWTSRRRSVEEMVALKKPFQKT